MIDLIAHTLFSQEKRRTNIFIKYNAFIRKRKEEYFHCVQRFRKEKKESKECFHSIQKYCKEKNAFNIYNSSIKEYKKEKLSQKEEKKKALVS